MKPSKFNIVQTYNGNILIYNTFTTAMVEMGEEDYENIFVKEEYGKHEEVNQLIDLGFLIGDECNESLEQERLRKEVIDSSSDKIANIIIAPTLECNAHCFYCFENGFKKGKMSIETADRLVDYLQEHWNGEKLGITWFGGEPLLAADIIDRIIDKLRIKKINFSSKITTNGSLLNKEMISRIKAGWNTDKIQITIDALEEEYNNIKKYDNLNNAFQTVIDNVQEAIYAGFNIKIRINFDPMKQEKALKTLEYLNDKFERNSNLKVYFAPIDEDNNVVKNIANSFPEYSEHPYISLIKFGRQHGLYRGFPDMEDESLDNGEYDVYGFLKKLKIYPSPTNCYATCPNVYSIDCNGKIYKCHRALGREEYASGDIFTGIQKNEIFNFFCNTEVMYEECKDCSVLPICQGGCKINAKLYHGKEACVPSKSIIKELILLYKKDLEQMEGGERNENC